jgi:biotin-dependent carboxylase-like uncharacterized protein
MSAHPQGAPILTVLAPGMFTTLQDLGRPGLAAWGVGRSGAADRSAAALANRLVANPPAAAVLEMTMGGLAVLLDAAVTVALTGAPAPAELDGAAVSFAAPLSMAAGSMLRIGTPVTGLRTYLAVRGGVAAPPVLGSRSYDVLAALGPPPVQAGDILPIGPAPHAWPHVDVAPSPRPPARITILSGSLGPHVEALAPDGRAALTEGTWTVSWDSDRSGLRLDGAELDRVPAIESPPEGVVRGAVQVPPSGRPVVMLADHPVTGGYPAVAALDDSSCDAAAQLRPGDRLRLVLR